MSYFSEKKVTLSSVKGMLVLAVLLGTQYIYAQPDTGRDVVTAPKGSGLVLPPTPAPSSPSTSGTTVSPSIFDDNFKRPGTITKPEINSNFGRPETWANPDKDKVDKLNKIYGDVATAERKNQNFGEIKTSGKSVTIRYRDHGEPDGDVVRIFANDGVMRSGVLLGSSFEGFSLTLEKGTNKIEFVALNQGTSGPNTAEFEVIDENGNVLSSNQWNLLAGFKATIFVVKRDM